MKRMAAIVIAIILLSGFSAAFAVPLPSSCTCEITAKVIYAKEKAITKSGFESANLTYLNMRIEIKEAGVKIKEGTSKEMNCDEFKFGRNMMLYAIKERDLKDPNTTIKPGMIIKGNIQFTGDSYTSGYNFTDISVVRNF